MTTSAGEPIGCLVPPTERPQQTQPSTLNTQPMPDTSTKGQFLELRAKGWSFHRIAARINVPAPTLLDWYRQHRADLRAMHAMEIEAIQEKVLLSHEEQLTRLGKELDRVEKELANSKINWMEADRLYHLAALLRSEIRKERIPQADLEQTIATPASSAPVPAAY